MNDTETNTETGTPDTDSSSSGSVGFVVVYTGNYDHEIVGVYVDREKAVNHVRNISSGYVKEHKLNEPDKGIIFF